MSKIWPVLVFESLLAGISTYWLAKVNATVKGPYLDEFFHVRQALVYWSHQWRIWDPKITTPPGLYLVSYVGLYIGRFISTENPIQQLRAHNVVGILLVFLTINQILTTTGKLKSAISISHTAFNICTFPPLFFFSGLYYTDVISVLVVLKAHGAFNNRKPTLVTFYSLLSLWFRQTNIFWTAIYLGGSEVVRQIKSQQQASDIPATTSGWADVVRSSWSDGILYDPTIHSAYFEDYMKMAISLALSALRSIQILIKPILPYGLTLGAFAGFILWNRGVVLGLNLTGDKDNHIASLHLPQMLYIWPYIAFFSWPVILPSLIKNILGSLPSSITKRLPFAIHSYTPRPTIRLVVLLPALLLTILIIHFNTIIHPFTLADNRHYTFYVFRILRRHAIIKYLLAPVYLFFAWACIGALTASTDTVKPSKSGTETRSSMLLLWLITSSLSLATAPLVEPRYFILPWIVWRMNVATEQVTNRKTASKIHPERRTDEPKAQQIDLETLIQWMLTSSLPVETVWYLVVNGITGWIFLTKGFAWPNEAGEVMRFMW